MRRALALVLLVACVPANAPEPPLRARARASVLSISEGVKAADDACAVVAKAQSNLALAERCGTVRRAARAALMVAEASLDAASASDAACAAGPATTALVELVGLVRASGGTVPPSSVDGVEMAHALAVLLPCSRDGGSL